MDNTPIGYLLQGMDILFKKMGARPEVLDKLFTFDLNMNTRVQAKTNLIMPIVNIRIRNGDTPEVLAEISCVFSFQIIDFERFILLNEEGLYVIPPHLEAAINPIAISTTRGIMYSEFKGTYLHNAILPIIMVPQRVNIDPEFKKKVTVKKAKKNA